MLTASQLWREEACNNNDLQVFQLMAKYLLGVS